MKLSILVPVYNEEEFVQEILRRISQVGLVQQFEKEVILVNDCSTDKTKSKIQNYIQSNPNLIIHYHEHEVNKGKGCAIRTGISKATGDYILIQDADLEYDPNEYNDLLKPVVMGMADVVYGSRFMGSKPHRVLFFWHTIGNKFLTFLSNVFTNLNLTDMECCYKLFRSDILKKVKLRESRFGFEPEVTARISRIPNIRIYEVGVSYYGRTYDEGKKIGWMDGVRAIFCIVKYGLFK